MPRTPSLITGAGAGIGGADTIPCPRPELALHFAGTTPGTTGRR